MTQSANEKQVGGEHYRSPIQHWDYVHANNLDYFQAQITKYVTRWKNKNGMQDLQKAFHFLQKYIELQVDNTVPIHILSGDELEEQVANLTKELAVKEECLRRRRHLEANRKNDGAEPDSGYVDQG